MNTNQTAMLVKHFEVDDRYANSIPSGWTLIVFEAMEKLVEICPEIKFIQIKEKFASLRIYFELPKFVSDSEKKGILEVISRSCDRARKHCQDCGNDSPGVGLKMAGPLKSWHKIACNVCEKP